MLALYIGGAALGLALDADRVAAAPPSRVTRVDAARVEAEARTLDRKLLAPCCYLQTLDTRSSELTSALRREIRERLAAGESISAVEHALVERYGAKILAVPPSSPLETVAFLSFAAVLVAGGVLWWRVRRWVRKDDVPTADESTASDDAYDAALDEALDALDRSAFDHILVRGPLGEVSVERAFDELIDIDAVATAALGW